MADIDLQALAAPIESLKNDLLRAYSELDQKWEAVANTLRSLVIPGDVAFMYWDSHDGSEQHACLEWRKWKGSRKLCVVHYTSYCDDDGNVVPYEEWSGYQRLHLLQYVPKLFQRAEEATKQFIAKVVGQEVAK
jgi:hypothetical protein